MVVYLDRQSELRVYAHGDGFKLHVSDEDANEVVLYVSFRRFGQICELIHRTLMLDAEESRRQLRKKERTNESRT